MGPVSDQTRNPAPTNAPHVRRVLRIRPKEVLLNNALHDKPPDSDRGQQESNRREPLEDKRQIVDSERPNAA
jgi:hypothetical protein